MRDEPSVEAVSDMLWDYIFVGGGLSASVVSNRLLHFDPSLNILVVEAGENANNDPSIVYPNSTNLIGGEYDWKYKTVPQLHVNNRNIDLPCGKALGGGTVINSGGWSRGNRLDFDLWAETVDDHRWSYDGLLPYMKMTETAANASINPGQHGDKGPIYIQGVVSTHREFPLREKVLDSWKDVGVDIIPYLDGNAGEPNGVGELFENRREGRRQIASAVYPLTGITVVTNTLVSQILIKGNANPDRKHRATGIKLANGTSIRGKEVILSAGAIRTPQILMLSGLGPQEELKKHSIPVTVDLPDVGQHLADHPLFPALWKIKDPSKGYAIGSGNPLFKEPQYGWGVPTDFLVSTGIEDKEGLAKAIEEDEGKKPDLHSHPLLKREHTFNEHVLQYVGAPDGSTVVFALIGLRPTSRGSVKLASPDIKDVPLIDPNYRATAVDRFIFREGIKLQIKLAGSKATILGREILDGELGAPGFDKPFTVDSTDEYIDKRVEAAVGSTYHPMGTAAMGKVVDTSLRVAGVAGLRVVDTSVFPVVITAHLQVATYAMAERAAEIIYLQRKCDDGP